MQYSPSSFDCFSNRMASNGSMVVFEAGDKDSRWTGDKSHPMKKARSSSAGQRASCKTKKGPLQFCWSAGHLRTVPDSGPMA